MRIKAVLEIEYEVDPKLYTFTKPGDEKEAILRFERALLVADIDNFCPGKGRVVAVKIEEIEDYPCFRVGISAAFTAYICHVKNGTQANFDRTYLGEWVNEEEFAVMAFTSKYPNTSPVMLQFVDYKMFARDLFSNLYFSIKSETGVYVFTKE